MSNIMTKIFFFSDTTQALNCYLCTSTTANSGDCDEFNFNPSAAYIQYTSDYIYNCNYCQVITVLIITIQVFLLIIVRKINYA